MANRQAYMLRDRLRSKWVKSLVASPYLRDIGDYGNALRLLEAGALAEPGQFRGARENEIALNYSGMRRPDLSGGYYATGRDTTHRAPGVYDRN